MISSSGIPSPARLARAPSFSPLASRISREKNYFFLLSAMKEVFSEMPDAYLVFIGGGGSLSKKVKREVRRLGLEKNILFAGELARAKVDEYYAASDILVLSSLMETQGLVMSEAAALGKPSVIVRSGGAVEYVKNLNDGLITKIDKHEYARAVLRLLKNPALSKQYGENGFKNVKTGLSPDVIYPKLITLYKNAIKTAK